MRRICGFAPKSGASCRKLCRVPRFHQQLHSAMLKLQLGASQRKSTSMVWGGDAPNGITIHGNHEPLMNQAVFETTLMQTYGEVMPWRLDGGGQWASSSLVENSYNFWVYSIYIYIIINIYNMFLVLPELYSPATNMPELTGTTSKAYRFLHGFPVGEGSLPMGPTHFWGWTSIANICWCEQQGHLYYLPMFFALTGATGPHTRGPSDFCTSATVQ